MKPEIRLAIGLVIGAYCGACCGGCCPVDANPGGAGACGYPGSSGSVTVVFEDAGYTTPGCWQAAGGSDGGGLLESDNIHFAGAALGVSMLFFTHQENDTASPVCSWQSGLVVPLTSNCLSLVATGTNTFIASAGYQAVSGSLVPTGSLTLGAWPAAAGQALSVTFSIDAQVLYTPDLNVGGVGDAGLLPIFGTAASESTGPVAGSGD